MSAPEWKAMTDVRVDRRVQPPEHVIPRLHVLDRRVLILARAHERHVDGADHPHAVDRRPELRLELPTHAAVELLVGLLGR
eukprot:2922268-Prymnesium_polylepis.1